MKKKPESRLPVLGVGIVIGVLLTSIGFTSWLKKHETGPEVKIVTITKVVNRTRVVHDTVDHTTIVKEVKLYRASRLDANGNIVESWTVTKCKFRVVGAQLTDADGKTFEVHGNIKVEPIK